MSFLIVLRVKASKLRGDVRRHWRSIILLSPLVIIILWLSPGGLIDHRNGKNRRIDSPFLRRTSGERQLRLFEDIEMGDFLNKGSINAAFFVKLPDWWHELHSVPKSEKMIMKITRYQEYAAKEIDAMERLNGDKETARRLGILPVVAASRNISNPFYCDGTQAIAKNGTKSTCSAWDFPDSSPETVQQKLRQTKYVAVSIVPFRPGRGLVFDELDNLDDIRTFMRSLLGQLAHAHDLGINNLDLSGYRNVLVDHDNSAILFDWNGAIGLGEKSYNPEHAFSILPPESWLEQVEGHDMKMMSISGFDVWSVGIMFAWLIYKPCHWTYETSRHDLEGRLKETIMAIGGNTIVKVNDEFEADLAEIAGLDATILKDHQFKPLLGKKCNATSFPVLERSGKRDKQLALNFLQSIMKLSPIDRPDCQTLLKHPFLRTNKEA